MSTKTNNVVSIGHNSNQLTDKLIDTLNQIQRALELIDQSSRFFERSCKGRMDRFDTKKMHWSDKAEWFERGKTSNDSAIKIGIEVKEKIKEYLKANGVELEKGDNEKRK
jgi:hypothetical protein